MASLFKRGACVVGKAFQTSSLQVVALRRCVGSSKCSPEAGPKLAAVWNPTSCLRDHRDVYLSMPKIFDAYIGPNSVAPKLNESIMLAVNSVNACPYCDGLHGELARMAGVEDVASAKAGNVDDPAVEYAKVFARNCGRGEAEEEAFGKLARALDSSPRAGSIRALCWFLHWGSYCGNTLNAVVSGENVEGGPLFKVVFVVYYGPLFLAIALINRVLLLAPVVPAVFSAAIGAVLATVATVWLLPLFLASVIAVPFI